MLYRSHLRFKGYWLSFLSWLVLTFAVPLSSAVASDDQMWMRLCSSMGVQWVSVTVEKPSSQWHDCTCLSLALAPPPQSNELNDATFSEQNDVLPTRLTARKPYALFQPRSPPTFS